MLNIYIFHLALYGHNQKCILVSKHEYFLLVSHSENYCIFTPN